MKTFLFFYFLFLSLNASAVCLYAKPTVKEEFEKSDLVFIGKAIDEVYLSDSQDFYIALMYSIQVEQVFKGTLSDTVISFNQMDSGRFQMDIGEKYIIFTRNSENTIRISSCGNSNTIQNAEHVINQVKALAKVNV